MSKVKKIALSHVIAIFLASSATGCGAFTRLMEGESNSTPAVSESTEPEPSAVPADNGSGSSSQQPSGSSDPQTKLDALRRMNCQDPSQADYVDGNYQIGWTAGGDRYEGVLSMEGDTGMMRLRYFNESIQSEDIVDQTMVLAVCPQGLILVGINPTPADSQESHPTYASDNILMRREPDGSIRLSLVDDNGVTAPVEISEITN